MQEDRKLQTALHTTIVYMETTSALPGLIAGTNEPLLISIINVRGRMHYRGELGIIDILIVLLKYMVLDYLQ